MAIFFEAPSDEDLEAYTRISEYSEVAYELEEEVTREKNISIKEKQDILYPILEDIKMSTGTLIQNYIEHLKDKENLEKMYAIRDNIAKTMEKIEYFKNKVYDLNKDKNF